MKTFTALLAGVVSAGLSTVALAVPTAWSPAAGSAATFDFSDGSNSTGLNGNPSFSSNTFIFNPTNFRASAPGNGGASDESAVTLTPHSGFRILSLEVKFSGDSSNLGGIPSSRTSLVNDVAPFDPSSGYSSTLTASRVGGPAGSVNNSASATYEGQSVHIIDDGYTLSIPSDWRKLSLSLSNILSASQGLFGGTGFAELKTLSLRVSTVPAATTPVAVPLPLAAFAAIPTAGLAAWAVRRSKKRSV